MTSAPSAIAIVLAQELGRILNEPLAVSHADFVNASEEERELSLKRSSELNDGYRTLRDPVARVEYLLAIEYNPDLADARYRLGQAYVRTGEKQRAEEQFQIYQRLRAQHLAELDKQRAEIRQFVYSAKHTLTVKP